MMKALNWYLPMVKSLVVYLEIQMEPHWFLILEQIWDLYIYHLMVLMIINLKGYCFEFHWDIHMVMIFTLMKASDCYYPMVSCLLLYLEM